MSETFKRLKENFVCGNCKTQVEGNGYTDHCPKCLYSKHVDIHPGDRESLCGGLMEPLDIAPFRDHYVISYECLACGYKHNNKSSNNDDITSFIESLDRKDFPQV